MPGRVWNVLTKEIIETLPTTGAPEAVARRCESFAGGNIKATVGEDGKLVLLTAEKPIDNLLGWSFDAYALALGRQELDSAPSGTGDETHNHCQDCDKS
jgi:hypothetical protein